MSLPWRFIVVGSCRCQKISSKVSYAIICGLNVTCTASACPVAPDETCSYDGFSRLPPMYPEMTSVTPLRRLKIASVHQKQPPANVACCKFCDVIFYDYNGG